MNMPHVAFGPRLALAFSIAFTQSLFSQPVLAQVTSLGPQSPDSAVVAQERSPENKTREESLKDYKDLEKRASYNARVEFYQRLTRRIGYRPVILAYSNKHVYHVGRFDDPYTISWQSPQEVKTFISVTAFEKYISSLSGNTAVAWVDIFDRLDAIAINTGGRDYFSIPRHGTVRRLQVIDGRVLFEATSNVYLESYETAQRWDDKSDERGAVPILSSRVRLLTFEDDVDTVRELAKAGSAYRPPPVRTLADLERIFKKNRGTVVFLLGHNESGVFVPPTSSVSHGIPLKIVEDFARSCCGIIVFPVSCKSFQVTGDKGVIKSFNTTLAARRLAKAVQGATTIRDFISLFASEETPVVVEPRLINKHQELHIRLFHLVRNGPATFLQQIAMMVIDLSKLRTV